MVEVFKGSEALARGGMTRARLRWNYRALFPDVYAPKEAANSLRSNTVGAWLWARRDGVIAGRAAAALHGAKWIDDDTPVEMIWRCGRPPAGIIVRKELVEDDEIVEIAGLTVTSLQRTASPGTCHATSQCDTSMHLRTPPTSSCRCTAAR